MRWMVFIDAAQIQYPGSWRFSFLALDFRDALAQVLGRREKTLQNKKELSLNDGHFDFSAVAVRKSLRSIQVYLRFYEAFHWIYDTV